jgi:cell division protease FtsH
MVCEFGMSELGPLTFGKKEEQIFLGREINQHRDYSEDTAIKIDQQVERLITNGYTAARGILTSERELLIRIAEALLEREVLDANEMKLLIDGKDLPPRPPLKNDDHQPPLQQVLKPERRPVTGAEPAPA